MITFDLILVILVIVFILVSLYLEIFGPAFTFLFAILILAVFNVLSPKEVLSGLANEQVAVIIMLLLLGDIIRKTSVIENVFDRLFRSAKSYKGFLNRMMLIVATFSAFLNNTPLVAIMMPYVHNWCKRNEYSPSKFLIPLSYAAILGGSVTLIGTSTNLIVKSMVEEQIIIANLRPLQMFDFAAVGLPMVGFGFLYISLFGHKLLPGKHKAEDERGLQARDYIIETKVRKDSNLNGKRLGGTTLNKMSGLQLIDIIRDKERQSFSEDTVLRNDDILVFAGDNENIAELVDSRSGLVLPEVGMMSKMRRAEIIEVVVSQNSTLIGKAVYQINFRSKYDAAVLAVHRNGEQIKMNVGEIILRAGDVLLIYAGVDFFSRTQQSHDFYYISKVRDFVKPERYKLLILFGGTFAAIFLAALNVMSLFLGLLIVIALSIVLKIANPKELPKSIDYNLAVIIVLSLALGTAMIKSNAADMLARGVIAVFRPMGVVGVLFGIYFITTVLAAYITNKASVGIIFPIAITIAKNMDVSATPFVLVVAYAAAANFMTPIGYQTNIMVYGPGRYSFKDFFKIGSPLTLIYMVVTVTILSLIYF